ncbi:hypothetical protein PCI56_14875 [Plesiomonas shigelloides subsp. oncorhynchi]|nr:hypothetical protein [Plesiomonas shigelloides]
MGQCKGIVGSWLITPLIAGILAYGIFISAQRLIFDTETPMKMLSAMVLSTCS